MIALTEERNYLKEFLGLYHYLFLTNTRYVSIFIFKFYFRSCGIKDSQTMKLEMKQFHLYINLECWPMKIYVTTDKIFNFLNNIIFLVAV